MVVGSFVLEDLEGNPRHRDASPYLVWEWLVVEALIREISDDASIRGVPGTGVTRRALAQHEYVDARSYLKTPRIFGFHGVYKPLAVHLGLLDVHLGPGPNAERLADAWARGRGLAGIAGAKPWPIITQSSGSFSICFPDMNSTPRLGSTRRARDSA